MRCLVIGNPENRRVALFLAAAQRAGINQGNINVLPYETLLKSKDLEALLHGVLGGSREDVFVRIDSPGENSLVQSLLVARGFTSDNYNDNSKSNNCDHHIYNRTSKLQTLREQIADNTQIQFSKEWYWGYCHFLKALDSALHKVAKSHFKLLFSNTPAAIASVFNKPASQRYLAEHGLPIPKLIVRKSASEFVSYAELKHYLLEKRHFRVFVKLSYGSSASGVVALRIKPDGSQVLATTSVELQQCQGSVRLYNSLRLSTYKNEIQVANIINVLIKEGIYVESWVPKHQVEGKSCDMRMVAINNQAKNRLLRLSRSPITNLHLGNERAEPSILPQSENIVEAGEKLVEQASASIQGGNNLGFDILITARTKQLKIVEVNAFGDLLPGNFYHNKSTQDHLLAFIQSDGKDWE